jgi:hypothetical protein
MKMKIPNTRDAAKAVVREKFIVLKQGKAYQKQAEKDKQNIQSKWEEENNEDQRRNQ